MLLPGRRETALTPEAAFCRHAAAMSLSASLFDVIYSRGTRGPKMSSAEMYTNVFCDVEEEAALLLARNVFSTARARFDMCSELSKTPHRHQHQA